MLCVCSWFFYIFWIDKKLDKFEEIITTVQPLYENNNNNNNHTKNDQKDLKLILPNRRCKDEEVRIHEEK